MHLANWHYCGTWTYPNVGLLASMMSLAANPRIWGAGGCISWMQVCRLRCRACWSVPLFQVGGCAWASHCPELSCCEDEVCLQLCSTRDFCVSWSSRTVWKVKDWEGRGCCGGKFAKLARILFDNIQINVSQSFNNASRHVSISVFFDMSHKLTLNPLHLSDREKCVLAVWTL